MLDTPVRLRAVQGALPEEVQEELALSMVLAMLRRQASLLSLFLVAALALAAVYLGISPNRFTATAQLLTDTNRSDSPSAQYGLVDTAVVDSQVETIKSEKIALSVINKLRLIDDPEFTGGGLVGEALHYIGLSSNDASAEAKEQKTIAKFKRGLAVVRIGRSYVANVMFTSTDPHKAAEIANEVANSYIEDQLDAKALTAARASSWMQKRIAELREQAAAAAREAEQFNAAHPHTQAGLDPDDQTKLEDLTGNAQSLRRAYDTLLNLSRYSQSIEERTLPITDARIVTQASPPLVASSPDVSWTLMVALVVGGGIGMFAALLRDQASSRFGRAHVFSGREDSSSAE